MYPQRELIRLDAYKAALLRDIAINRAQCVSAAIRISQPLAWLDRLLAFWRQLTPLTLFAAVPLAFILRRTAFPHLKILGFLVRWSPLVFATIKSIQSSVTRHTAQTRSAKAG